MKSKIILIFSCLFTLFLATAAQASNFSDNTCHEEGANCQTEAEWKYGWCEAAVATGVFEGTAEQCTQPGGGGGRLVGSTQSENRAQGQNTNGGASGSGAAGAQRLSGNTGGSGDSAASDASGDSSAQGQECQRYRVSRSNPSQLVCDKPGLTPGPTDSEGSPFDPFDTTPKRVTL